MAQYWRLKFGVETGESLQTISASAHDGGLCRFEHAKTVTPDLVISAKAGSHVTARAFPPLEIVQTTLFLTERE
jgi:hypothetical protein